MGRPLYTNNAATYLAFGITNTATTMQVSANAGNLFPNPTGGDYFYVSLISLSGPIIEIVKCTARSGDIFTIERGQEGTTAQYWNTGDNAQLRITAAGMNYIAGSTASTTLEQSFTATQGQTVFTLTTFDYSPGTNNLAVFVNGSKQVSGTNYSETSVNVVTFTTGLNDGDVVEFLSNLSVAAGTIYATDINYNEGAAGAVTRTLESKLQESVSVKDFGAVGDFNPTTGVGTDNRLAIQAALDYAKSVGNCTVYFPQGKYYLGTGLTVSTSGLAAQLILGSLSTTNNSNNVTLDGQNASIYQGSPGCMLAISNANNTVIQNLNMYGYAGGTLGASRERDLLVGIFHSSKNTTITNCYITNSLGYTLYTVGDPNVAGGGTTETCLNIRIQGNTIKTRYGNGVSSYLGGSKSLWAMAAVDVQGLLVDSNTIYGVVDIEPNNVSNQSSYGCYISNNQFMSGYVTPVVPAGVSTYWADEPIGKSDSGGTIIAQGINLGGATGAPVNNDNVFSNNSFDFGTITVGPAVYACTVANNAFRAGKITVGSTSGGNVNRYYKISNNSTNTVTDATSGFIVFGGSISYSEFHNNLVINQDIPVISWDGVGGADAGGNTYVGNSSLVCVTNPAISLNGTLQQSSTVLGTKSASNEILTWTPTLTDGTHTATLSNALGYYTLQGRTLSFNLRVTVSALNSLGSNVYVTLPIASNNTNSDYATASIFPTAGYTPSANTIQILGQITANSSQCSLWQINSSGGLNAMAGTTNIGSTFDCVISGTYFTN